MKIADGWTFDDAVTGLSFRVIVGKEQNRLRVIDKEGFARDFWFREDGEFDGTGAPTAHEPRAFFRPQTARDPSAMPVVACERGRALARGAADYRVQIKGRRNGQKNGTIIAEGDSWLEYPLGNLRSELEALGWDVFSVAGNGDRLEEMVYSPGQQEKLARAFEKCADREDPVKAVFVSGGGNDVMGDVLALFLNHSASGLEPLNWKIIEGQFDRLVEAFRDLASAIDVYAERYLGAPVPILTHGYDYPYPTGRGFLSGFGPLPGPWLEPQFNRRGYEGWMAQNVASLRSLVDLWNERLEEVAVEAGLTYLDFRGTLKREHWKDELHPTRDGFGFLAQKIDAALI